MYIHLLNDGLHVERIFLSFFYAIHLSGTFFPVIRLFCAPFFLCLFSFNPPTHKQIHPYEIETGISPNRNNQQNDYSLQFALIDLANNRKLQPANLDTISQQTSNTAFFKKIAELIKKMTLPDPKLRPNSLSVFEELIQLFDLVENQTPK